MTILVVGRKTGILRQLDRFQTGSKPDSVGRRNGGRMTISLGRQLPGASSDLPGSRERVGLTRGSVRLLELSTAPLFGLAPDGVYRARSVTRPAGELLPHRFTLTAPTPKKGRGGGFLSVALSLPDPSPDRAVGVTHHRALRSPDFPPRDGPGPLFFKRIPGPEAVISPSRTV